MGKISIGNAVLAKGGDKLALDDIPFRSDLFVDGQFLRYYSGEIVTAPAGGGGGGGSVPTLPYRIVNGEIIQYDTIQEAINACVADDVVYIPPGNYEENFTVGAATPITLIAKVPYRTRLGGTIETTVPCRIIGFWISGQVTVTGSNCIFDLCEFAYLDGPNLVATDNRVWVNFGLVPRAQLVNGTLYAKSSYIVKIEGTGTAYLYNSYIALPPEGVELHHSGGSPSNFPDTPNYHYYNIPWAPPVPSYVVYRDGKWKPEPLPTGWTWPINPYRIVGGTIAEYSTIQEAIDASSDGDVIYVPPGTYDGFEYSDKKLSIVSTVPYGATITGSVLVRGFEASCVFSGLIFAPGASVEVRSDLAEFVHCRIGELELDLLGYQGGSLIDCSVDQLYARCDFIAHSCVIENLSISPGCYAYLYETYLKNRPVGVSGATIVHSGGSEEDFEDHPNYEFKGIPWKPAEPSILICKDGRWGVRLFRHAEGHQEGGDDELNVNGLHGRLADYQSADQIGRFPVDLNSTPLAGYVLTWDGSKIVWAACSGGGGQNFLTQCDKPMETGGIFPTIAASSVPK
ncbi:hypothetical protein [Thermogutta sp.]|uniref:hypothetical protein n=1 Tax=Thermogutta sp. TaxID=1962930 RepID=UPI00322052C2